jgi:hypothetical protein
MMADLLEKDIENPDARYTNPVKPLGNSSKPRFDLSLGREDWVVGVLCGCDKEGYYPDTVKHQERDGPRSMWSHKRRLHSPSYTGKQVQRQLHLVWIFPRPEHWQQGLEPAYQSICLVLH